MAKPHQIKGTKTFLYWAIALFLLALWAIRDGWFPAASTLDKYPDYPGDSFYTFNRSLAVLSMLGSIVCGFIHRVVK